jgi:transglutaminase-like putative cysteine protease
LLAGLLGAGLTLLAVALDVRTLRDIETLRSQLAAFWRLSVDSFAAGENGPAPLHPRLIGAGLFFALWMNGVWAGWGVFRWRSALRALIVPGLSLGGVLFFSVSGYFWGGVFLFAFVLLAVSLHFALARLDWEARGVDYSPELGLETYLAGIGIALVVTLTALAMPSIRVSPITDAFWRVWAQPYARLETRIGPLFSRMQRPPRSLIGGGSVSPATMPRAHLLGGKPELTERVVMTVWVDDPDPAAPTYWSDYRWRGPTYAWYTGRGWENPAALSVERLGPGETWLQTLPADRRPLRQEFRFEVGRPYWLYAAGEPLAADVSSRAYLLGEDNLMGMTAGVRRYEVLSQAPIFDVDHLRAAPDDYPPALSPYLDLPESVSQRTRDLAARITADARTPYDRAIAIQNYLRSAYPYTLEIDPPPEDVDVVDYFLFDLQEGYCDYYASAMVVMARSLGIPARLAVGYAPGDYDARQDRLIVREKDAHSWPELYFPGYGWIPFEPTPARPQFQPQPQLSAPREANKLDVLEALRALRLRGWRNQLWRWGSWLLAGLAALLLGRWAWREWRLRRQAGNGWQLAWLRLERAGPRFGVTPAPWLTPREFAGRWADALTSRYPDHPALPALLADINALAQNLETRAYAPPARHPDDAAAGRAWRNIRSGLWRLRIKKARHH